MTEDTSPTASRGHPHDALMSRGDLLRRCGGMVLKQGTLGSAPRDLVEPIITIGDIAYRYEIYRHPATNRSQYVVLHSPYDRTRSVVEHTGTLTACRQYAEAGVLNRVSWMRWAPRWLQYRTWRWRARSIEGFEETVVKNIAPRAPTGWDITVDGVRTRIDVADHPQLCAAAAALHAAASDGVTQLMAAWCHDDLPSHPAEAALGELVDGVLEGVVPLYVDGPLTAEELRATEKPE